MMRHIQRYRGNSLRESFRDLRNDCVGCFFGDFWRNSIRFFVNVIFNFRGRTIRLEKSEHVRTKIFGNNDSRIIRARMNTIDSFFLGYELPIKLRILAQRGLNIIAHIHRHRNKIGTIAFIGVSYCHPQFAGVTVRIPTSGNIKPGIHGRHNHETHSYHNANNTAEEVALVFDKNLKHIHNRMLTANGRFLFVIIAHHRPPHHSHRGSSGALLVPQLACVARIQTVHSYPAHARKLREYIRAKSDRNPAPQQTAATA